MNRGVSVTPGVEVVVGVFGVPGVRDGVVVPAGGVSVPDAVGDGVATERPCPAKT